MPAIRERIYLCPDQNGQPGWIVEFPLWWDRSQFFEKYGDRQIECGNPFYDNYGLLLTPGEAREWDRNCREAFAQDPRSHQTGVIAAMRQWDELIQTAGWIIVESYEWESGLE